MSLCEAVSGDARCLCDKMLQLENENKKLKQELDVSWGKEKKGRQFVITSKTRVKQIIAKTNLCWIVIDK